MGTPSNSDDIIDSRSIIKRIEELEEELEELEEELEELDECLVDSQVKVGAQKALDEWHAENDEELAALRALADEGENSAADWEYGATLIRDSYFEQYAQELAEDIGAIDRSASWPNNCIDWERAARELQMDYSSVEFDSVTYWVRS